MATAASLLVRVSADTAEFTSKIKSVREELKAFAANVKRVEESKRSIAVVTAELDKVRTSLEILGRSQTRMTTQIRLEMLQRLAALKEERSELINIIQAEKNRASAQDANHKRYMGNLQQALEAAAAFEKRAPAISVPAVGGGAAGGGGIGAAAAAAAAGGGVASMFGKASGLGQAMSFLKVGGGLFVLHQIGQKVSEIVSNFRAMEEPLHNITSKSERLVLAFYQALPFGIGDWFKRPFEEAKQLNTQMELILESRKKIRDIVGGARELADKEAAGADPDGDNAFYKQYEDRIQALKDLMPTVSREEIEGPMNDIRRAGDDALQARKNQREMANEQKAIKKEQEDAAKLAADREMARKNIIFEFEELAREAEYKAYVLEGEIAAASYIEQFDAEEKARKEDQKRRKEAKEAKEAQQRDDLKDAEDILRAWQSNRSSGNAAPGALTGQAAQNRIAETMARGQIGNEAPDIKLLREALAIHRENEKNTKKIAAAMVSGGANMPPLVYTGL